MFFLSIPCGSVRITNYVLINSNENSSLKTINETKYLGDIFRQDNWRVGIR